MVCRGEKIPTTGYIKIIDCDKVESIDIHPEDVIDLTIENCSSLKYLNCHREGKIKYLYIENCPVLTDITLPEEVEKLGFYDLQIRKLPDLPCKHLTMLFIYNCPNLSRLDLSNKSIDFLHFNFLNIVDIKLPHSLQRLICYSCHDLRYLGKILNYDSLDVRGDFCPAFTDYHRLCDSYKHLLESSHPEMRAILYYRALYNIVRLQRLWRTLRLKKLLRKRAILRAYIPKVLVNEMILYL